MLNEGRRTVYLAFLATAALVAGMITSFTVDSFIIILLLMLAYGECMCVRTRDSQESVNGIEMFLNK